VQRRLRLVGKGLSIVCSGQVAGNSEVGRRQADLPVLISSRRVQITSGLATIRELVAISARVCKGTTASALRRATELWVGEVRAQLCQAALFASLA
jgi:hypothetical protein